MAVTIQQEQLNKFFEILASSKLISELEELTVSPSNSHFVVIQSGANDSQKISVSKLRGALGNYNASTNTPSLVNGTGVEGDSYVVTVAGTRDFGNGNLKLSANDVVEYRNGKWIKLNQISLQNVIDALSFTPEDSSLKGMANGYAPLNESIKIDAVYLPAYVEEIIEGTYVNTTTFNDDVGNPVTPVKSKIYLDTTSSIAYRWGGSQYLDIKASPGTSDAVAEGSVNLYYTNARVLTSVLTGFVTGANTSLTASDSVLSAFEKLQGQINALITSVASFADEVQPYDNLVNGVDGVLYLDAVGEKLYIWKNAAYVAINGGVTQAQLDAKVEDVITDGVLDKAPSQNAVFDALAGKQANLVSGTNIRTVNGESLLGSTDLVITGGAASRTIKPLPNTTQYTLIAADFTDFILEFTANANEEISIVLNAGVAPLNGELQMISTGNNKLVPSLTGVTATYPEQTNPKTILKGWLGGIVTATDTISFNGSLESTAASGIADAPSDGTAYNRKDATWIPAVDTDTTYTPFTNTVDGLVPAPNVGGTTYSGAITSPTEGFTATEGQVTSVTLTLPAGVASNSDLQIPTSDFTGGTPWKKLKDITEKGESLTGTVLSLHKQVIDTYNYATPSTATTYTTAATKVVNGAVRCFINAATEPTVTGATKISGDAFVASTVMTMIVNSPDGVAVEYYFLSR